MMRALTAWLATSLSLLSFAAMAAPAAQTGFDTWLLIRDPRPPIEFGVNDGDPLNTTYSYLGITLGCFNGTVPTLNLCTNAATGGDAFARSSVVAASSPNVVYLAQAGGL